MIPLFNINFIRYFKMLDKSIFAYVGVTVAYYLYSQVSSLFVSTTQPKEEAALYFAAFTIANIVNLILNAQIAKIMPDLIILDVMMPKINGYKISRLLKYDNKYKNIPILMVTARSQEEDKLIGEETGVDEYITKPFDLDEVVKKVDQYLGSQVEK